MTMPSARPTPSPPVDRRSISSAMRSPTRIALFYNYGYEALRFRWCGGGVEKLERVVGVAGQAALGVLLNERFKGGDRRVFLAGLGLLDGGAKHFHFFGRDRRVAGFPFPIKLFGHGFLLGAAQA